MGALPRPDVPPGAQWDLVDALHRLHHLAGWPSLRTLAREVGCSHTTVSAAFSSARLPTWGLLELLVEAMGGDTAEFHKLWLAASSLAVPQSTTRLRIAGRTEEIATVHRHIQSGEGLLLVTGEAGIGKTTLLDAVAAATHSFTATGHCLPLASEVPLMPFIDALSAIHDVDEGAWLQAALLDVPSFVPQYLARLLPQLGGDRVASHAGEFTHYHLFASIETVLERLAQLRPLALLFEDFHWADPTTLDVVEHLLGRSHGVPVVGSWRTEDEATAPLTRNWLDRVQRLRNVRELRLGPLTRDETAEQLALLGPGLADRLESIHSRSLGQPLFTEQLALHADTGAQLPQLLGELLDRRLDGLPNSAWRVLRILGLAECPLLPAQLAAASKHSPERLTVELHVLRDRRLVSTYTDDRVQVHHPLLAEAVRRRLVPGEAVEVHRSLAEVLAQSDASAAEVASHWRSAEDGERELQWRVLAARSAAAAFDWAQEAEHWLRVLELWPHEAVSLGDPPIERPTAYIAAIDALRESLQWDRAAAMSDAAETELGPVDAPHRAELLLRAADYRGDREGVTVGLALADQALEVLARLPPSAGHLRALNQKRWYLIALGRYDEGFALARAAVEVARVVGSRRLQRNQLVSLAWHEGLDGAVSTTFDLLAQGRALLPPDADPMGDIRSAMNATHVLLVCGAALDIIQSAAQAGIEVAQAWGIDNESAMMLTANLATARLRAGLVPDAEAGIGVSYSQPDPDRWPVELLRAAVDTRKGRLRAAAERVHHLLPSILADDEVDLDVLCVAADVDFWCGTAHETLPRLLRDLDQVVELSPVRIIAPAAVAATRGVADVALLGSPASRATIAWARELVSRTCRRLRPADQREPHIRAHIATAQAELARAVRNDNSAVWVAAASLWDALQRPHDAGYCRWRAAQAALRSQPDITTTRMLGRAAARDARHHVPLSDAIKATMLTTY